MHRSLSRAGGRGWRIREWRRLQQALRLLGLRGEHGVLRLELPRDGVELRHVRGRDLKAAALRILKGAL